jgi:O-antigen/teichoic acid export membrane protein
MDPEPTSPTMGSRIRAFLFKNQSNSQTVAKNSFWLTVSNFGGRLIKAGVIVYGARVLGTSGWGVFSYAITLAGFLTLFMDPGVNNIIMREIGRADDEKRRTIFATTFALKLVLMIAGVLVVIFVAPFFSTLPGAKALLRIVAVILALDTLREFLTSYARGMERMEFDAAIFMLTNFGILILGFILLTLAKTPASLAWAYVGGDILGIALAVFITRTFFKKLARNFSAGLILPILQSAWPFAVTSALALLLTNTDILIISWIKTASAVGIYASAIRIIQVLYLIPTIFQFSTLPLFARFANKDDVLFRGALEQTIGLIFLASIPLAIGGAILGTGIMSFVFGSAYAAGGTSFRILSIGLMFDFPAVVVSSAIFAYNRQKSLIVASAIAGAINVAFDILLIPRWGINGSSMATLIAQIASNWYLWHMMKKINNFSVLPSLKKIGAASVVMAAVIGALYFLHAGVIIAVIAGALVYFGMLRVLREPLLIEVKRVLTRARAKEVAA